MNTSRNAVLEDWMKEHGYSANSLAEAVNSAVGDLTGRVGGLDGSSVRDWKAGRVRWPKSATRVALEKVTGLPATALGFVPRGQSPSPAFAPPSEDAVERRRFIAAGTAMTAAAATPMLAVNHRVGTSDVERLQRRFSEIIASDHRHGGRLDIERKAAALADEALALQHSGSASQRVRSCVYGCAAAFRSSAMWAAIDGRRYKDAVSHMREAQALAELAADPAIKFRIWSHAGTLYRHMGRLSEAIAANDVARSLSIARRDPMFACLGHARQAASYGLIGDTTAVRRTLGRAEEALERADPILPRPAWMAAVGDGAELETLALAAHLGLGEFERAEARAHRGLALLRPQMQRDRALNTARLALAQLGQGDLEPAIATAMSIPTEAFLRHPRIARLVGEFDTKLHTAAPRGPLAREWDQYAHGSWKGSA
ncbi:MULTISPECIES: Tat pathway signal sequence domain protein [unclassified Streptomyces]|uniref:Tat pathway signal sequence domain protein n=1 Tax=unclassified Streptomyces TaxID=2593676 RepID=UPI0009963F5B|nr:MULTISPECIES: Tat pathway signal sequence domain protein [unclassified Streptomyces]MYT30513.1 XRE family transcriptional regulator [Streptomyces sp. SID8354]